MLAFRSLDPFRALREPDRRRRDEERLSRSEQRTISKTQNNHLTGKAPYKFESGLLQQGVCCEPASLHQIKFRPRITKIEGQRATAQNLLAHAPQRLHDEVSADYNDMIYTASPAEIEQRRRAFLRKWRLKCKAVADSLEE